MSEHLAIRRMEPLDATLIDRQPSQRIQLGLEADMSADISRDLATSAGEAWTAWRGDTPIACLGIRETFPGAQGVAWAILSLGLGADHLRITRHARRQIAASRLIRIEAIVLISAPAECAWCAAVGLKPEAILRRFGARSEDHMLYSRIL